jgi:hypothetical protein
MQPGRRVFAGTKPLASGTISLFITSVSGVIDFYAKSEAARENHVPEIWSYPG